MHAYLITFSYTNQGPLYRLYFFSSGATLERGYAIVSDAENRVLVNHSNVSPGDTINARLQHGRVVATVAETHAENTDVTQERS